MSTPILECYFSNFGANKILALQVDQGGFWFLHSTQWYGFLVSVSACRILPFYSPLFPSSYVLQLGGDGKHAAINNGVGL